MAGIVTTVTPVQSWICMPFPRKSITACLEWPQNDFDMCLQGKLHLASDRWIATSSLACWGSCIFLPIHRELFGPVLPRIIYAERGLKQCFRFRSVSLLYYTAKFRFRHKVVHLSSHFQITRLFMDHQRVPARMAVWRKRTTVGGEGFRKCHSEDVQVHKWSQTDLHLNWTCIFSDKIFVI